MAGQKMLFMDWRNIQCGHLEWRTDAGERLGVGNPPEPPVPMRADARCVPHGIRLESQPAQTSGPVDGWKGWGRTIYDGGRYRSRAAISTGNTRPSSPPSASSPMSPSFSM